MPTETQTLGRPLYKLGTDGRCKTRIRGPIGCKTHHRHVWVINSDIVEDYTIPIVTHIPPLESYSVDIGRHPVQHHIFDATRVLRFYLGDAHKAIVLHVAHRELTTIVFIHTIE